MSTRPGDIICPLQPRSMVGLGRRKRLCTTRRLKERGTVPDSLKLVAGRVEAVVIWPQLSAAKVNRLNYFVLIRGWEAKNTSTNSAFSQIRFNKNFFQILNRLKILSDLFVCLQSKLLKILKMVRVTLFLFEQPMTTRMCWRISMHGFQS